MFEVGSGALLGEVCSSVSSSMGWDGSGESTLGGFSAGFCGVISILRFLEGGMFASAGCSDGQMK